MDANETLPRPQRIVGGGPRFATEAAGYSLDVVVVHLAACPACAAMLDAAATTRAPAAREAFDGSVRRHLAGREPGGASGRGSCLPSPHGVRPDCRSEAPRLVALLPRRYLEPALRRSEGRKYPKRKWAAADLNRGPAD